MADHELEIVARYKDLASKGVKALGSNVQKMATKAAVAMRVVGSASKKMGKAIAGAAALAKKALSAMLGPLKLLATAVSVASGAISFKLIGIASDAAETASKFNVLFGTVEESANSVADSIAGSFGRSKADVRDYMGTLQALLTPMDLVGQQGLEMSSTLAKLAIDMASFANASDSEALLAIRSGLSGESEPLRRFGIFLSEARVKTEALTLGISQQGDELTNQQKILARYSIIQKDSVVQQGDAIRTANEYEGTMKRLGARIKDLAVIYGDRLKVAVLGAIEDMGGIEGVMVLVETAMGSMVETVGRLIPKIGEIAGGIADSIKSIGGAAEAVVRLADAYDRLAEKAQSAAKALGLASLSRQEKIAELDDEIAHWKENLAVQESYGSRTTQITKDKIAELEELRAALQSVSDTNASAFTNKGSATGQSALAEVASQADQATEAARKAKALGFDPLTDAMLGGTMQADAFAAAMAAARAEIDRMGNLPNGPLQGPVQNLPNGDAQGPTQAAAPTLEKTILTSDAPAKKVTVLAQAVANLNDRFGDMEHQLVSITERAILDFGNGLTNALASVINPMKSGKQAMKEFAASFLADLSAMIAKALIFKAIMAAIGAFGSGGGGNNIFNPATSSSAQFGASDFPQYFGGGSGSPIAATYAGGGPGASGGQAVNVAININAMDGSDVQRVLVNERGTLRSIIQDAMMTSPSFRSTMLGATV